MRQNGQRHIFKGDGRAVIELEIIRAVRLAQRGDLRRIELLIIGPCDAVLQFLLRVVGQEEPHHLIGQLLIGKTGHFLQGPLKLRHLTGHKEASVAAEALQDRL